MKRITSLAVALALTGAFAVTAQAAPQDYDHADRDHYEHRDRDYGHHDRYDDSALDRRVSHELNRELGNDADDIRVTVRHGNVYLSGWVDNRFHLRRAREVARNVEGVRDVYARDLRVHRR
jgi:osmotically-inducible protein OsmY